MSKFITLSFVLLLPFMLSQDATAFNITKILGPYTEFNTFSSYLTQSQIVSDINDQGTITVLAVDNSHISPLSGKPVDVLKKIMEVHIILDYYDPEKLEGLKNKTFQATTLFQRSGIATNKQGFVNITVSSTGDSSTFTSAAPGSTSVSKLISSVTSEPYNISVLQISAPIIPAGIDDNTAPPTPPQPQPQPPSSSPPPTPTPSTQPPTSSPPPSNTPSPSDASPPSPSDASPPSPGSPVPTPAGEGPAPSPGDADDGGSSDDGKKNSANEIRVSVMWGLVLVFFAVCVGV